MLFSLSWSKRRGYLFSQQGGKRRGLFQGGGGNAAVGEKEMWGLFISCDPTVIDRKGKGLVFVKERQSAAISGRGVVGVPSTSFALSKCFQGGSMS